MLSYEEFSGYESMTADCDPDPCGPDYGEDCMPDCSPTSDGPLCCPYEE